MKQSIATKNKYNECAMIPKKRAAQSAWQLNFRNSMRRPKFITTRSSIKHCRSWLDRMAWESYWLPQVSRSMHTTRSSRTTHLHSRALSWNSQTKKLFNNIQTSKMNMDRIRMLLHKEESRCTDGRPRRMWKAIRLIKQISVYLHMVASIQTPEIKLMAWLQRTRPATLLNSWVR